MIAGYLQRGLVAAADLESVRQQLHWAADTDVGSRVEQVFTEAAPAVSVLWQLLRALDGEYEGELLPAVRGIAAEQRLDMTRLLAPLPPARAFWAAVNALQAAGGGWLVVPHYGHLDNLGPSRTMLLRQLSEIRPPIAVHPVAAVADPVGESRAAFEQVAAAALGADAAAAALGVVGEFALSSALGPAREIVALNVRARLMRAGLGALVDQVEPLVQAVVAEAARAAEAAGGWTTGSATQMTIHMRSTAMSLVVSVREVRDHASDPLPATIETDAMQAVRQPWGSGTETRFEIPLDDATRQHERASIDHLAGNIRSWLEATPGVPVDPCGSGR